MQCRKCKKEMDDTPFCPQCGAKQSVSRTRRGNGTGSAYKRGNGWVAQITVKIADNGKQVLKRKCGFKTKKDALTYLSELEQRKFAPAARTLKYYYDSWLETDAKKLSDSKQCAYRVAWNKIEEIHTTKITDLNIVMLRDLVSEVAPTFYPARDIKTLLSHIFKLAIADQQIAVNMSEYITLPKANETEKEPFTQEEIEKIWSAYEAGEQMAAYMLLMIYTGMMPGELMICEKSMIDWANHRIIGSGLKTEVRKKAPIVFPDFLTPVIETIETFTPSDYYKLVRRNKWDFYEDYHAFTQKIGIRDLPMYSCRHTTATALAVGSNISPSIIQKAMRHSRFTTTQHYIHPDTADVYAALNTLQK